MCKTLDTPRSLDLMAGALMFILTIVFFELVWFRRCHVFLITAVCMCIQHTHTHLLYYQLFVPYHWYTEIEAYSNSIYLVRALLALSCYTKRFITCYQMLSIYIDASNNKLFCVQHIILGLLATYFYWTSDSSKYLKLIFIPKLAQYHDFLPLSNTCWNHLFDGFLCSRNCFHPHSIAVCMSQHALALSDICSVK